jgi:hypothetical protein
VAWRLAWTQASGGGAEAGAVGGPVPQAVAGGGVRWAAAASVALGGRLGRRRHLNVWHD